MRNNRERLLANSSIAAIGAALAVAAAFPNTANALPAGCVLLGNQVTCTGTVGAPDANVDVDLNPGQNLINNATIYGTVFGSFANTITNNVAIISSANESFSQDFFQNDTINLSAYALGVHVGNASVLHNNSLISATAGTTTNFGMAGGEGSYNFSVYGYTDARGVERDWGAQIYNDCVITATASNSVTITNFSGDNYINVQAYATGIYGNTGPNLIQNSAGNTIAGNASNVITLSDFGETFTQIDAPIARAAGIMVSTGSVVDNHGTVSATATTTITATNGFGLLVNGAQGSIYEYVPDTSFAIGIGVDHMASITNSSAVTATATLTVSLTNVSDSNFEYNYVNCFSNSCLNPGARAIGIYVGNQPNRQEGFYDNNLSIDTIINTGTVTATATTAFTLVDSPNNYVDVYSTAIGILAAYTREYCCPGFFLPGVFGTVAITNSGTVTATATTTLSFTLNGAEMSSGGQTFYLSSNAYGIAARRIEIFGGGEGGGPIATIVNNGTVTANAVSAATLNITDYYGSFSVNPYASAVGIWSDAALPFCCGSTPPIGPNITNNGTVNVTGNASVNFSYTATDAGWGEITHSANIYAGAAGIVLNDGYGIVQNFGPINATATATWSVTSTGNGWVGFYGNVNAEAVGINATLFSNIYNASDITATATASVSVTSNGGFDNVGRIDNLYISSNAVGIGGAEGFAGGEGIQLKVISDGNINATATSLYSSNAGNDIVNYNYLSIRSDARGIWVPGFCCGGDRGVEVVNNGTITALALSQFTLTNPGLETPEYVYQNLYMSSYAAGIQLDDGYGTATNNGTIIAVASTVYKLVGFSTPTYGSYNTYLYAGSYGMRADCCGYDGYSVVNNGTIFSTATVLVDAPNHAFYGYTYATAYGIYAGEGYFVHNTGSIFATATVTLPGGAEAGNAFNYFDPFFEHWRGNSSSRPARAYGVKIEGNATFVNDGMIWANAYVSVGGTILQGQNDPSAAFGIYGRGGDTITNNGIVGTSRVGPMHWAVYISGHYGSSQFYNYGTTIGSFHINGEGSFAQNFATMTFRTIQPSDGILQTADNQENPIYRGEVWAQYGTYDRIAVHTYSSFDTTNGTILIQPLGNAGLYPNTSRFRYFIDCDQASSCNNISGLTLGQQANLKSTSAFLVPSLDTPADIGNVGHQGYDLILTRLAFTTPNLPGNQGALGGGLEGLFGGIQGNPGGALGNLLAKIQVLGPGDVPGAYQQLAGEIVSNIGQIGAANAGQLLGLLFGRFNESRGGVQNAARNVQFASRDFDIAQAPPGASRTATTIPGMGRWTGWVSGYGQTGQVDSQSGITGAHFNVAGGLGGLELNYSETVRIGFTLGAGSSWVKLNDLDSRASGTFFQAAIYGSYAPGPWYVDAAVGYAHHSIDTKRTVNFPGFSDHLKGSTAANQFIGGFEAGWRFDVSRFQVTPFFGMQFSVFSQDSYTESGGAAALSFGDTTTVSARSSLGIQGRTRFDLSQTMRIDPYARIAWAHEFGDRSPTASASFVGVPSSSFSVVGAKRARDSFLFGTGFDMTLTQSVGVFANYLGDFSSSGTSHAGTAGVRVRW